MSRISMLHVSAVHPHPDNIRGQLTGIDELAASIRAQGILEPLVAIPDPHKAGHYLVTAGHRRLAGARRARLEMLPVIIRRDPVDRVRAVEVMLVENCQRVDLTPMEKARAFGALRKAGRTLAQISQRTGLSGSTVSYYLSLLDLDAASQARVEAGVVGVGDAIAAVRKSRARGRPKGSRSVIAEPRHFTMAHPLAKAARLICRHPSRPKVGGVACGQCWEQVIRDDAATAAATAVPGPGFKDGGVMSRDSMASRPHRQPAPSP